MPSKKAQSSQEQTAHLDIKLTKRSIFQKNLQNQTNRFRIQLQTFP